jgi:hypothetical protein
MTESLSVSDEERAICRIIETSKLSFAGFVSLLNATITA